MTKYEKLVEQVAKALCETRTWPGAWIRANEVEMAAWRYDACVALATVAKALETVTPKMIYAWEMAPIPAGVAAMTDQEANSAMAQSNWSAMLAASALGKGE